MNIDWNKLQNGSDIRGVALEGVTGESVNLSVELVEILGKAFCQWLENRGYSQITIAIGMDSRLSGEKLKAAFAKGITSMGANVIDCALASTPAMFMTTISNKIDVQGGVMLTASHLPFNRNGLKFFTKQGGLSKADISEILALASTNSFNASNKIGSIENYDFIADYAKSLVETIRKGVNHPTNYNVPLQGFKIIVDAGNGAGGFFADKVLKPLGANVEGSQFLEPDGMFPNHIPNPEDPVAMQSICHTVVKHKADLGIIFDTDVDRSAVVDQNGNPINRNALIALIASIILNEHPNTSIVTDSITSTGLTEFITNLGGIHHRFKRGYKNVINESIRLNKEGKESWLAIETSGHAALKENHFLDDGAFLVAKLLIKMAQLQWQNKTLGDLIATLRHSMESKEFRFSILENDFQAYGNKVISQLKEKVNEIKDWSIEPVNHEGLRVNCNGFDEKGWFLLRLSLHDPVMPLNIESDVANGVNCIKEKLGLILSEFSGFDNAGFQ